MLRFRVLPERFSVLGLGQHLRSGNGHLHGLFAVARLVARAIPLPMGRHLPDEGVQLPGEQGPVGIPRYTHGRGEPGTARVPQRLSGLAGVSHRFIRPRQDASGGADVRGVSPHAGERAFVSVGGLA